MTLEVETIEDISSLITGRLKALRLAQNVSQAELAAMASVSLGAVRQLEKTGKSSLETIIKISKALGVVDDLNHIFVLKTNTIAQMQAAQLTRSRKRASKK